MIKSQQVLRLFAMVRRLRPLASSLSAGILLVACAPWAFGDFPGFQRTVTVALKDPVTLDIEVSRGDVMVAYNRDGQVAICASARDATGKNVSEEVFGSTLTIQQTENHITIRHLPAPVSLDRALSILYKIDVPSRTQITSKIVGAGNQRVIGIAGPAKIVTGIGDIEASYIRYGLVTAETRKGKISCVRVARVEAETGSGSITLMEDGPSKATVKKGLGKVEVGGARGGFIGSTDRGELHIRSVLWDDWQLNSISGNIRIELPPRAKFEADVLTKSGEISIERADMAKPDADCREYRQTVNGGGKRIQVRSDAGNIWIE